MTGKTVEVFKGEILPPAKAEELWTSMPSHIKPAVFERNLMNALMANPDLMNFDPRLVYREVAKAAGLGLLLDPLLGEAYLVTAYNYKSKRTEPQLRVGYKGMCKLARQSGTVRNIYAHEIHQLDHVEADLGFPKVFHHKPKLFSDRGPIIGYVAVITFDDGTFDFEPMSTEQCQAIRDRSDAWKAFKENKIRSTPWSTDEAEMSKKTVLRRLLKRQHQSPEMVTAQRIEDEAEFPEMSHTHTPAIPRDSGPPSAQAVEPPKAEQEALPPPETKPEPKPEPAKPTEAEQGAMGFGEPEEPPEKQPVTISTDNQTFRKWADEYIAAIGTTREPGTVFKWADANHVALDKIAAGAPDVYASIKKATEQQLQRLRGTSTPAKTESKPEPKPEPKPKASRSRKKAAPTEADDPEALLRRIDAELARVDHADSLEEVWNDKCAPLLQDLMPPDQDAAQAIYQQHFKRLGGD